MAYIKQDFIEKIKDSADIVDVISVFCKDLKKKGANHFCSSPFSEDKTPSLSVDPVRQRFKDFSTGKGGNAINFIMELERLTFPEAIEWLAKHTGHEMEYEDSELAEKRAKEERRKDTLRPVLLSAHKHYMQTFQDLPEDHPAQKEIFEHRGYETSVVTDWEIGFAPGKQFLRKKLEENKLIKEGTELGLIGPKADKYWNRIVYPIRDRNGLLVGFAGRIVPEDSDKKTAKWINPKESILYHKSKIWYGLDRAARAITKSREVWIVEGYNDVIAWHYHGLENTIAPCGTSISEEQLNHLVKLKAKVIFCLDPDAGGIKAMLKYIPQCLRKGLFVEVVELPGMDPDDFVRDHQQSIHDQGMAKAIASKSERSEGFKILIKHHLTGSETEIARSTKELAQLIGQLKDDYLRDMYAKWLAAKSKTKVTLVNHWVKESFLETQFPAMQPKEDENYLWPAEITEDREQYVSTVVKYGLFQANNKIWMQRGVDRPYHFKSISNFSIEVIQHMKDDKFPSKLIRVCNVSNQETIFDTPSKNLNTVQSFRAALSDQGNYLFRGNLEDLNRLEAFLYDHMGVGRKIEILGWQQPGFWAFNNAVIIPGKPPIEINSNGVYQHEKTSFYIPSANEIYKDQIMRFQPQKKVQLTANENLSFTQYTSAMMKVHRNHAINAILFTVASIFQDIVVSQLGNFPIMFFYGQASTGKDQLIECCQSFFGEPQVAINMEGGISTAKAQIREFAQFSNMLAHLSEYMTGDSKLDGVLKGLWDRRGYKRANLDSHIGTDTIPILSSVMITGNHYPDNDALITRLIIEEMTKEDFTPSEIRDYEQLQDMTKSGISHFIPELLKHRKHVQTNFTKVHRRINETLKEDLGFDNDKVTSRLLSNIATLGAFYQLIGDDILFPFQWPDFISHSKLTLGRQLRKMNTASVSNKWWNCFLVAVRTKNDGLTEGREFSIDGDKLIFNMRHTYGRIASLWTAQYQERPPSMSKITDVIKRESYFKEEVRASRSIGGGNLTKSGKTSGWIIDLKLLDIHDDLLKVVEWKPGYDTHNSESNTPSSDPGLPF